MEQKLAPIVQKVVADVRASIIARHIDISSIASIIGHAMEVVEHVPQLDGFQRKLIVLAAIEEIIKGPDSVAGTDDDYLPQATISVARVMIENDLIGQIIDIISRAAKGELDVNRAIAQGTSVASSCFTACFALFKGATNK